MILFILVGLLIMFISLVASYFSFRNLETEEAKMVKEVEIKHPNYTRQFF